MASAAAPTVVKVPEPTIPPEKAVEIVGTMNVRPIIRCLPWTKPVIQSTTTPVAAL
jgi:hypothetical protein